MRRDLSKLQQCCLISKNKTEQMNVMNRKLIAIVSLCLIIIVISPVLSYIYFNNKFTPIFTSYKSQIDDLQQQNVNLTEKNNRLTEDNKHLTNMTQPYFVTSLGWYLHKSNDQDSSTRNSFNIYGTILNIGAENANSRLIINFYNYTTLLKNSTIPLGVINSYSYKILDNTNIKCEVADSVTKIEVTA